MYKININIVNKENKYQVRSTCLRDPSFNGEGDYAPPSPSDYFFLDLIKKSVIVLQVLPKFLTENCRGHSSHFFNNICRQEKHTSFKVKCLSP